MTKQPVLIAGQWRQSHGNATFQSENPALKRPHDEVYPVSTWNDIDMALDAASVAAAQLRRTPTEQIARFLELYAAAIESQGEMLVAMAHLKPRWRSSRGWPRSNCRAPSANSAKRRAQCAM